MAGTEYFGVTAQLRDHIPKITQAHIFAARIRLPTTTHNLLTFNTREISSNNSERLSLFADKLLWTFFLHSSYSSSRMTRSADQHRPCFHTRPGPKFTHLQFCSRLIIFTCKSLFPRPKSMILSRKLFSR